MVIAIVALGIALNVIVEMPFVDPVAISSGARPVRAHYDAVLGADACGK